MNGKRGLEGTFREAACFTGRVGGAPSLGGNRACQDAINIEELREIARRNLPRSFFDYSMAARRTS